MIKRTKKEQREFELVYFGWSRSDNFKPERPKAKDMFEVLNKICTVPNVWAICNEWETSDRKLFNKFMDMCAYFKNDEWYVHRKVSE